MGLWSADPLHHWKRNNLKICSVGRVKMELRISELLRMHILKEPRRLNKPRVLSSGSAGRQVLRSRRGTTRCNTIQVLFTNCSWCWCCAYGGRLHVKTRSPVHLILV